MKRFNGITIALLVLALIFATVVLAAAEVDEPINPVTEPITDSPTQEPITDPPTPEPTNEPPTITMTVPTPEPTIVPPTQFPTVTAPPTDEPTVTITVTNIVPGGGKGYIDTYCNVDGASVSFDGNFRCTIAQGVCTVGVSPTGIVHTVTVSKTGYITWSGKLPRMPADNEHVAVYATLNPVPTQTTIQPVQTGAIYAQSNPPGAAIYLNGALQGYSPVTLPNLPPGTYSMKASLSGYTPDTLLINVYTGQTATYYPNLQPSPPAPRSTGTVSVTSSPNAALIYVDDNYQGKAPLTITLYPGNHKFRLILAGYNDYTTSIHVSANTNQKLNAVLDPAAYGTVAISAMPGASVWIDSNSRGMVPSSGTLTLTGITSGNHVFKVTSTGYNDWINTVYILPNTITPVSVTLTPSGGTPGPAPVTGGLNIVSTPAGAEILIDNLFRGYTPSTLNGITAGQHQVVLKYTGYVDYSTTAQVNAGQTTPLAVAMQAAPTPTPESAPSTVFLVSGVIVILGIGVSLRRRS